MNRVFSFTFYTILGLYVVLLLLNPQFAPAEEPSYFLKTIQAGRFYPPYISFAEARFQPLHAQEYNLISHIFPATPFSYYLYNALQLIVFFIAFREVIKFSTKNQILIYSSLFLLLLSPGIANAWFRMIVGERGVVFWGILFLLFYLKYMEETKASTGFRRFILIPLIILCANLSIYYKETTCLAIGAFALCHFILLHIGQVPTTKLSKSIIVDSALVLSSTIFLLIYFFYIYLNKTGNYLEVAASSGFLSTLKTFAAYLFIDPILMMGLPLLIFIRILFISRDKQLVHPIYDSMLIAGVVYIATIFALGLNTTYYYLLPAYIFFIPSSVFFLSQWLAQFPWLSGLKVILAIAIFIQIASSIPLALENVIDHKYLPINANLTADFIAKDILEKNPASQSAVFLVGIKPEQEYLVQDFSNLLDYRGLEEGQYKTRSDNPKLATENDYLVVTPFSQMPANVFRSSGLENNLQILFKTDSKWAIPNYGLERIIKYFLIKVLPQENASSMFQQQEKLFEPMVDYTIFIRRQL